MRPYRNEFPAGEDGDIAFWVAYRRWQSQQAYRRATR